MKTIEFTKPEDTMPAEVATELLATPGARISSRMRRECWTARSKVISSPSPIRKTGAGYETDEKQVRREFADKCKARFAKLGMAKLVQMARSTLNRRLAVQRPFVKAEIALREMQEDTSPDAVVKNARRYHFITQLLQRLADEANRLDTIADVLAGEMQSRCLNVKV